MLDLLITSPIGFIIVAASLVIAIAIHEFAHAYAADRLGDPTPRIQGRLTLNPLVHLDPIGTLLLFIAGFGWGKPVQFDPYNLENPRRDAAIISFAGPLSNFLLAGALALILHYGFTQDLINDLTYRIIRQVIHLNIVLAVFNLVPVHPLDGGKILIGLLPEDLADEWDKILNQYGLYILLILILPLFNGRSLVSTIIGPIINTIVQLLIPSGFYI